MKRLVALLTLTIAATASVSVAQELLLDSWPTQVGTNAQAGQTESDITVIGLNSYDQVGNVTLIPLQSALPSVQLGDTLYTASYDAPTNTVTALVMYQADSSQAIDGDAVTKAVLDTASHNNWGQDSSPPSLVIRLMQPEGELVPAGTQFWVCSASGQLTFTGAGPLTVAEPAVVQDPSLFPPPPVPYTGPDA